MDDVCQALLLAAVVPTALGRRYFVSAAVPVTWFEFFESYARIVGSRGPQCAALTSMLPAAPFSRRAVVQIQP